jgi:hypothetical protein
MPYAQINPLLPGGSPTSGDSVPVAWFQQVHDNFECGEYGIARTVLGGAASSISSGTLPTVSNAYAFKILARTQNSAGTVRAINLRFNSDSSSVYTYQYVAGSDTSVTGDATNTAGSVIQVGDNGNESASRWSFTEILVMDPLGSGHKSVLFRTHYPGNLTSTVRYWEGGGVWASTSAITSVQLHTSSDNFVTGSSLVVIACNYV